MGDVLQTVSFAHFVDKASKYTGWNGAVLKEMKTLEKKMMNIACKIASSLSNTTLNALNSLTSAEVAASAPGHLLSPKNKTQAGVVTYVLLQKIDEFFKGLVNSYKTNC